MHGFWGIYAGDAHACAVDGLGALWCWGGNEHGQLGLGTTSPRSEPGAREPVRILERVTGGIALGGAHTCAQLDGIMETIACWGANGAGQLGDGTTELRSLPAPAATGGTFVAAGERHTCATRLGTTGIECWGWNERGQLGNGDACTPDDTACLERSTPVRVASLERADALAAGDLFTCAIESGAVFCWGANDVGQLGDTTRTSRPSPVRVDALGDVSALAAGANHACAISGGELWCWGRNAQGQLGDGTLRDSERPVRIRFGDEP
jgi:alpha-tubulin suppressor-like RCC1 family protein